MAATATIAITRQPHINGAAWAYKVKIDGVVVGKVGISATVEFPVTAGAHTVQMAQWYLRSSPLTVSLADGQYCALVAEPRSELVGLVTPHRFISLKPHQR